jgi:hypothetical protein
MGEAFHLGGWGMYPTLLFGVLLLAASVRYAVKPERRFIPLQISLGILTLAAGSLGFVTGLIKSTLALSEVKPDDRWIWVLGMGEALHCVALALTLVVLAALAAAVGTLRFTRMSPPERLGSSK